MRQGLQIEFVRVVYTPPEWTKNNCFVLSMCRSVAQPGSAPQWGCGGRRFKSSRSDQIAFQDILSAMLKNVRLDILCLKNFSFFLPSPD